MTNTASKSRTGPPDFLMPIRSLFHRAGRHSLTRYTSLMLGGAHRPRPPDYLALACRALEEVVRIDQRLRPYMQEEQRLLHEYIEDEKREVALRNVYGDTPGTKTLHQHRAESRYLVGPKAFRKQMTQLRKDERALAKTRLLIDSLKAKLQKRP
jgi:hypothetical protein